MKLVNKYQGNKYESPEEYYCELASELNRHIIIDDYCKEQRCLVIRIPGGILGGIWYDENNVITKIVVDTKRAIKTYLIDVNERLQKICWNKIGI